MTIGSTYICGTLNNRRKGIPEEVKKAKLNKGDHIWRRSDDVVVSKWKDKREVLTISNKHTEPQMVLVTNRRGDQKMKPNIVRDYNDGMSGIDRTDQMLPYHSALRINRYKKVGIHTFEMFLVNSFHLYNQNKPKKDQLRLMHFREKVSSSLIGQLPPSSKMRPQMNFHYMDIHPETEKKAKPTKPCRICSSNKIRRETRYFCATCNEKPALCVNPCFLIHHQRLGIATAASHEENDESDVSQ